MAYLEYGLKNFLNSVSFMSFLLEYRMQRSRGQFISSKSKPEDGLAGTTTWDRTQNWGLVDRQPPAATA